MRRKIWQRTEIIIYLDIWGEKSRMRQNSKTKTTFFIFFLKNTFKCFIVVSILQLQLISCLPELN